MTPNMRETFAWLRDRGFMVSAWTLDQRDEMSRAFDAGNYANAYESTDIEDFDLDEMSGHERAAFVLGFFSSYALSEIGSDREIFDECYASKAGQYVVRVAEWTDSRDEDYRDEEREMFGYDSGSDEQPDDREGV